MSTADRARGDEKEPSEYETQFLANISHELRTPLNSMLILSKLLLRNPDDRLSEAQLKWINTICNSGADLLKLIDDILDFSKVEAQTPRLRMEDVPLRVVSDQLRQLFQCIAEESALDFSIEFDESAPETIHTDPDRLKQILRNLVSNAMKFTESGWVKVRFYRPEADVPRTEDRGLHLAISVSDSGIGIAEGNRESIFQAFRQEDRGSTRKFGGTGLGLAISRRLAGLLGGEIRLESEKEAGSTFTLYLPERTSQSVSIA